MVLLRLAESDQQRALTGGSLVVEQPDSLMGPVPVYC
jgi:hypothetical protein